MPRSLLALSYEKLCIAAVIVFCAGIAIFHHSPVAAPCRATIGAVTSDRQAPSIAQARDMHLTTARVIRIADTTSVVRALPSADRRPANVTAHILTSALCWQVTYYNSGNVPVSKVTIEDATGRVDQAWNHNQVFWYLARGDENAYGGELNALIIFVPLCALFFLAFFDWRRPLQISHLDLLMIELFAVGLGFFNAANIPWSVVCNYLALGYLAARLSWIAWRGPRSWLQIQWSNSVLLGLLAAVVGLRWGLNITSQSVLDVGSASVVGAERLVHGQLIYNHFPSIISTGDTYGPLLYLLYTPFVLIAPWNGLTLEPVAAHIAALCWDAAVIGLLAWIGWRWSPASRDTRWRRALGLVAGWVLNPLSAYTLVLSSHDAVIGLALLAAVALKNSLARGLSLGIAGGAKILPWLLAPILGQLATARQVLAWWSGAAITLIIAAIIIIPNGLHTFYERTFVIQAVRQSPFTPWGEWGVLHPLHDVMIGLSLLATALLAWRAPKFTRLQLVAAAGAVVILSQMALNFWYYTYVAWFLPLVMLVLLGSGPLFTDPQPIAVDSTADSPVDSPL
jgi:hypothetical protein